MYGNDSRILIVDDSDIRRLSARDILAKGGYLVEEARTGTEAINSLSSKRYDLVIMELSLPDLSALEVLEEVKSTINANETIKHSLPPFILSMTAFAPAFSKTVTDHGFVAAIPRMVDQSELLATVEKHICR